MIFTINTDECTFCGICVSECPAGVISIDGKNKTAGIRSGGCIECSHCGMVCPAGAVRADGNRLEEYPAGAESAAAAGEAVAGFEHLIRSKRSVRRYKAESLNPGDLKEILNAGRTSATATNSQQVEAVLLQNEEVRALSRTISRVLLKVVKIGLNPAGRAFIKMFGLGRYAKKELLENYHRRITDTLEGRDDAFFFKAPAVVILTYPASTTNGKRFGRTDCALAGENMMLTAHARGIGSCMIGFAEAALLTKGLRTKAGVPGDRRIGLIFTLGYRKPVYYRYPARREWTVQ